MPGTTNKLYHGIMPRQIMLVRSRYLLLLNTAFACKPSAGAGVGTCLLTTARQVVFVPDTTVAVDFHKTLDIKTNIFTQIAFHLNVAIQVVADISDFLLYLILVTFIRK